MGLHRSGTPISRAANSSLLPSEVAFVITLRQKWEGISCRYCCSLSLSLWLVSVPLRWDTSSPRWRSEPSAVDAVRPTRRASGERSESRGYGAGSKARSPSPCLRSMGCSVSVRDLRFRVSGRRIRRCALWRTCEHSAR